MSVKNRFFFLFVLLTLQAGAQNKTSKNTVAAAPAKVWSIEKANQWYSQHKWISGANFLPSTAINQLEMWQAETYDQVSIDRVLGWAEDIGFTTMRVFLHSVAWKQDPDGFKKRVGQFLTIADKHHI